MQLPTPQPHINLAPDLAHQAELDEMLKRFYDGTTTGFGQDLLSRWLELTPTARLLLNQAGFGIGSVMHHAPQPIDRIK